MHDELDLAVGRLKLKQGGGLAGHNGLKSITQHVGTTDFVRLRVESASLGIAGRPGLGVAPPEQGGTGRTDVAVARRRRRRRAVPA
ncbi:MAG: aminoacyl-tRNA hydrolase [Acidimicrobiales bacterium]